MITFGIYYCKFRNSIETPKEGKTRRNETDIGFLIKFKKRIIHDKKYSILRAHMMQWHQVPSDNIEGRIEQEVSEETVITNQNTGFFASEQ